MHGMSCRSVRERLGVAFRKLVQLYPEAKSPPVTIVVGRRETRGDRKPVDGGLQIGLEALVRSHLAQSESGGSVRARDRSRIHPRPAVTRACE